MPTEGAGPRKLKALLLDLDGTVLDTHELIFHCYDHTVRTYCRRDGDRRIWERCVGLPLRDVFVATFADYRHAVTEDDLARVLQTYRDNLRANEAAVKPFPGMIETLEALRRAGVRLALVTTKHRVSAERHLESQRLAHLFEVVVTGDQCVHCKPHPEPFVKALAGLGLGPAQAAGVGDSEHDVRGARAAGLLAVAACWGALNRPVLLAAGPDRVAESPAGLLGLAGLSGG
jgi:pyrophosphatase PpaX